MIIVVSSTALPQSQGLKTIENVKVQYDFCLNAFLRLTIIFCSLFKVRHAMGVLVMRTIEYTGKDLRLLQESNPGLHGTELSDLIIRPRR